MREERTLSCLVGIKTEGDGWNYEGASRGTLKTDGTEAVLEYSVDGDSCTLHVKDGKIYQRRCGEQPLYLVFSKGESTLCTLGAGELTGTFKIYTHRADVSIGGRGMIIDLLYDNGGMTHLRLTAKEEQ